MRWALVLVTVFGLAALWHRYGPASGPELMPSAHHAVEDPCASVERCVVVYMTPWCQACRRSEGLIDALDARWRDDPRIALKVVVGQDHLDNLEGMAGRLRAPAFLDPRGAYFRTYGLRGVPHWLVKDAEGRVRTTFSGTYPDLEVHVAQLGVEATG